MTPNLFDLQAAVAGAPDCTRDGKRIVRVAHLPELFGPLTLIAVDDRGEMDRYHPNGCYYLDGKTESVNDLRMLIPKEEKMG